MSVIGEPKVDDIQQDKAISDYTEIVFEPDFKRFGMNGLDSDTVSLFTKRVYDLAGVTPNSVGIYLNGKKITKVKNF